MQMDGSDSEDSDADSEHQDNVDLHGHCEPRSAIGPPMVLVLDVDETLWRTRIEGQGDNAKLSKVDFVVDLSVDGDAAPEPLTSAPTSNPFKKVTVSGAVECHISLRPGLHAFFDWMRQRRREGSIEGPWVFTQGSDRYVKAVLSKVDPEGEMFGDRVLSRNACTRMNQPWPWVHKELAAVQQHSETEIKQEQIVLVENNVMSVLMHPSNSVIVQDWRGDGKHDVELGRVSALLDAALFDESSGEPGDYAGRLAEAPGHPRFRKDLAMLRERVASELSSVAGKRRELAIREVWMEALKVKSRFLSHYYAA